MAEQMAEQMFCSHAEDLSSAAQGGVAFSKTLQVPTPFAAADVISHDDNSCIEYHYTIIEVMSSLLNTEGSALSMCMQHEFVQ